MEENTHIAESLHQTKGQNFTSIKGNRSGRHTIRYENGVAVVEMIGPLYPRSNMMTMSGAVSVTAFLEEFAAVMHDPTVKAVVLDIDSPGGDVRKIGDTAKIINQLSLSGMKPVAAFASGYMASGAYYLGSAVGPKRLFASELSMVGSIGALLTVQKNADDIIEIVATKSPNKRPDVTTEEGQSQLRSRADAILEVFAKDVANHRGITSAKVFDTYGQGSVFVGQEAKDHKMVDKITTIGDVINMVEREASTKSNNRGGRMSVQSDALALLSISTEEIEDMGLKDTITKYLPSAFAKATAEEVEETPDASTGESTESGDAAEGQAQTIVVKTLVDLTRDQIADNVMESTATLVQNLTLRNKLIPADQAQAVCELVSAQIDDQLYGGDDIEFINKDGELVSGTRFDAAKARYENRTPHTLTQAAVKAVKDEGGKAVVLEESEDDTSVASNPTPMTAERRAEILGQTEQGRRILAEEKAKATAK